jgi:hypothetical protein
MGFMVELRCFGSVEEVSVVIDVDIVVVKGLLVSEDPRPVCHDASPRLVVAELATNWSGAVSILWELRPSDKVRGVGSGTRQISDDGHRWIVLMRTINKRGTQ